MNVRIQRQQFEDAESPEAGAAAAEAAPVRRETPFAGFEHHLLTAKRPWAGLAASALMHTGIVSLAWLAAPYVRAIQSDPTLDARLRESTSVYVQLRDVPLRLERAPPAEAAAAEPGREGIVAPASHPPAERSARAAARRFELPPLPRRTQVEQTLLQPEFKDAIAIVKLRLPEFVFWSPATPKLSRPVRPMVVVPGRKDPVIQQPVLTAAPSFALPTEDVRADLTALPASLNNTAKLQLPPKPAAPLRTFKPPPAKATPTASLDLLTGDPFAVVALHPDPAAVNALVAVPAGSQIGRLPADPRGDYGRVTARTPGTGAVDAGGTGGGSSRGGEAGAGGSKGGSGTQPAMPLRSGAGTAGGTGSGTGTGPAAGAGPGGGTGSGTASGGVSGGAPSAVAVAPLVQVHPKNGVFDVVVAHPNPPADVPNARVRLKGSPVYTVYLNVGKQPEWILRYCATNAPRVSEGGNVVQLGSAAPITPPYPQVTVVPPIDGSRDKMAVVHGFLTAQGQFRSLEAVRVEDESFLSRIEPLLAQWVFRPATRDGSPIEIEILLLLPRLLL